jgi:tetrahydromethanopterin S-methyltransferase subunit G|tara:strand:+ start:215 stop:394 length:180 start_codon:yes stop_codon:yes gene_type:complete
MEQINVDRNEFEDMKRRLNEIELAIRLDQKLERIENGSVSSKTVDSEDFIRHMEDESNL